MAHQRGVQPGELPRPAADGLLLGGNGFTWIKIGTLMGIPKPFLGDGPNRVWAERMRNEFNGETEKPKRYGLSEVIPWFRGAGDDAPPMRKGNQRASAVNPRGLVDIDPPMNTNDEALFQSWLATAGHREDAWAEKLLGRRKPRKEPRSN